MASDGLCSHKKICIVRKNQKEIKETYRLLRENMFECLVWPAYAVSINQMRSNKSTFNDRLDLTLIDIQKFYAYMQQNGKSVQEAHHCHTVMHRALEVAYRSDYILTNPADKVERPKSPKFKAKFYTAEQMLTLFQKLQGDPYEYIYKLTAIYGIRSAEKRSMRFALERDQF